MGKKGFVVVGLVAAIGVFATALFEGSIEFFFNWLFGVNFGPAYDWSKATEILAKIGFGTIALAILIAAVGVVFDARSNARRAQACKTMRLAVHGHQLVGDIFASEDGRYVFAGFNVKEGDWNPTHPFFNEKSYMTTPQIWEVNREYHFTLLKWEGQMLTAMPLGQYDEVSSYYIFRIGFSPIRHYLMLGLGIIKATFDNASIPLISTFVVAIIEGITAMVRSHYSAEIERYVQASIKPLMTGQTDDLVLPPNPLRLVRLDAEITPIGMKEKIIFPVDVRGMQASQRNAAHDTLRDAFPMASPLKVEVYSYFADE